MPIPDARGRERRRERRYEVELPGNARASAAPEGEAFPVMVSDLSASGALISAAGTQCDFQCGDRITLLVAEFGAIEAQVAHVAAQFYGLQFLTPHLHRDRLSEWLRREVGAG